MEETYCPNCGEKISPVPVVITRTTRDRFREFRQERVAKIKNGEHPIELKEGPLTVLHMVPASFFDSAQATIDLVSVAKERGSLAPLFSNGYNARYSYYGYMTYDHEPPVNSYLQVFRKGGIETVDATMIAANGERQIIPSYSFEDGILKAVRTYLPVLERLGIESPLFLSLSLLGVKGYRMAVAERYMRSTAPIAEDDLLLDEVVIEHFDSNALDFMKPLFDFVWNASGFPSSINFKDGEWVPQR